MSRYIDAELFDILVIYNEKSKELACGEVKKYIEEAKKYIDKIPTADVQEVRHGLWIGKPFGGYSNCRCSVCNSVCEIHVIAGRAMQKYCPNCGAKMDEEEKQ